MTPYVFQRGETISLALDALSGDPASVSAIIAKLKAVPPGRAHVPPGAPVAAEFGIASRPAAGEIPAGWTLTIPAAEIGCAFGGTISCRCAARCCGRAGGDRKRRYPPQGIGVGMTLVLRWRQPDPPIRTRWRGPDGSMARSALAVPELPVATLIGPPGAAGPAGVAGPAGPSGPVGATGPAGPQGATGPTGPQGPAGVQGDDGPAGSQGATGAQGPIGNTGPQGATGANGAQGSQGDAGPQGATGPQGSQGPQGPAGPQGPPGSGGGGGLAGEATLSLPAGPGVLEWNESVAATGITSSMRVLLGLAPTPDADENAAEMLDLVALSGASATGAILVTATFSQPASGPVKINWSGI